MVKCALTLMCEAGGFMGGQLLNGESAATFG